MNNSDRQKSQLFHTQPDANNAWKPKYWKPKLWKLIRNNLLVIATFSAVLSGIIVGCILRATVDKWTPRQVMYVNFIGELFLRLLKSLILPLIVTSLITGISSLDIRLSRKIGARAVAFYLTTTFLAVVLGIIMVTVIRPGLGGTAEGGKGATKNVNTVDTLLDLVRNLFPPNIIQACLEQSSTNLTLKENANPNSTRDDDFKIQVVFVPGTNIIGLVAISTVIGIAMSALNTRLANFIALTNNLYVLTMKLTAWAMWLSPLGIFFLVVAEIIKMEDMEKLGKSLGLYFLTVVSGLLIQGLVVLPIIYFVLTRFEKNPFRFIRGLSQALVTAFGTSSSSATMPVTLKCIIENNKVDENVAKFMLPIGSAINMDGTALYEAVAAIFISQLRGVDLTFGKLVAISITATAASIGAAGIPSAGLVTMIMVLDTVGIPAEDVSLILAVDWLLDRIRTVVNVMGDAFGAGIIYEWSKDDIRELSERNNSRERNRSGNSLTTTQSRNQSSINLERKSDENK
ncbi:excitatory amino acid transporter-like [Bradysia coprophila]|uniref:excitatory amino acid transporter-like n=1 Tax=Bradysia coprophila TaxID=38358 RepID=UPI00187D7561|nr:excitatory amino acid transporter-like [Bradysia coprophila]